MGNWFCLLLSAFTLLASISSSAMEQTIEDRILGDRVGTYEQLSRRLREKGPNASFPEFKPVVDHLVSELNADWFLAAIEKHPVLQHELTAVKTMLFHVNFEFSYQDRAHYPYEQPFDGPFPYRPTIDAIERAISLFDTVDRLLNPDLVGELYHYDRYAYHRHKMMADPRTVIIPTLKSFGFNPLIEARSVPIGFIGVVTRGLRVDRHYQTPLDFWYHDLNHVRRMVEYLYQTLRQHKIMTFEEEIQLYRSMDNFIQNTLMPHIQKVPLSEREEFIKRALLRVLIFEIVHESALPADRQSIIDDLLRRPGIAQPFEVQLSEAPGAGFNQEDLRTNSGNLVSGAKQTMAHQEGNPTVFIHYIHDRALGLLANVYNKLTHGFFDDPDAPKNYVAPEEARTPERILEAAKSLFRILEFGNVPDDGTLLGWITAKNGSPEKFKYDGIKNKSDTNLGYGFFEGIQPKTVTDAISADEAIAKGRAIEAQSGKRIITFMGFSAMGYQHPEVVDEVLISKLRSLDPKRHIINCGATKGGISRVYELAKKMGFETMGVVSTKALAYAGQFSPFVDHFIIVNDDRWGGRDRDGKLSPVTQVFVDLSQEIFAVGGNGNTAVAIQAFEALGKHLTFIPAEMDHENARREALYRRTDPPSTYEGSAFHAWKSIAAERVSRFHTECERNLAGPSGEPGLPRTDY